jgi:hypothetical protein
MHWRGGANKALSSTLAGGELRDLVTLLTGLTTYKHHPAVHLPVGRRSLWKSCDSKAGLGDLSPACQETHPGI